MFTVDLFKGQAIPEKTGPRQIAIVAVAVGVPLVVVAVMLGAYLSNRVRIGATRNRIERLGASTTELADVLKAHQQFLQQKNGINIYLAEVSEAVTKHFQWSPIVKLVAENIPSSVLLTKLEAKQKLITEKRPAKDDPKKTVNVSIPVRTLNLSVCGKPRSGCDLDINDFGDFLRSSELLGGRLEDIKPTRRSATFENREVVTYDISCIFKPGM